MEPLRPINDPNCKAVILRTATILFLRRKCCRQQAELRLIEDHGRTTGSTRSIAGLPSWVKQRMKNPGRPLLARKPCGRPGRTDGS